MGNAGIRAMMEHLHSNYTFNTSWRCHKTLLREAARDPSPSDECPVVKWNLARDRAPPNLLVSGVTVSRCVNGTLRNFTLPREGPYWGLLIVESAYKRFHSSESIKTLC